MTFGLDPFTYLDAPDGELVVWKALIEKAQDLALKRDRRLANLIVNNIAKMLSSK